MRGYEGLRMHYLDEGGGGPVFLLLHGEPTWAYLYRRMIPALARAGRVVAPDLFGFGRSDKPTDDGAYTFDFHRDALLRFIERLDLQRIVLVVHDWGGLLGLTLPPAMPERIEGLFAMNTAFATGEWLSDGFRAWRAWVAARPDFDAGALMGRSVTHLTPAEAAAYAAPFPEQRAKAGARRFPAIVPEHPNDPGAALSREARDWFATHWRGRSFVAAGMRDPVITPPVMRALRDAIPGAPPLYEVAEALHFVPEWSDAFLAPALRALI